ncbi:MAG TPA: chemotaxis protein CheW, partial [Spirochaetota bacterium]|nr:chemotaxis protein CheW [Spirochaetota bacterium]
KRIAPEEGEIRTEESKQYVTFALGDEIYGISVLKVQSINEMMEITPVPKAKGFIKGVINLRGSVIPVVDMRRKFMLPEKEYDSFSVILIVEANERLMGMIVDSVSDVVDIPISHIQSNVDYTAKVDNRSIEGIGRIGERLVVLLDVDHFLLTD